MKGSRRRCPPRSSASHRPSPSSRWSSCLPTLDDPVVAAFRSGQYVARPSSATRVYAATTLARTRASPRRPAGPPCGDFVFVGKLRHERAPAPPAQARAAARRARARAARRSTLSDPRPGRGADARAVHVARGDARPAQALGALPRVQASTPRNLLVSSWRASSWLVFGTWGTGRSRDGASISRRGSRRPRTLRLDEPSDRPCWTCRMRLEGLENRVVRCRFQNLPALHAPTMRPPSRPQARRAECPPESAAICCPPGRIPSRRPFASRRARSPSAPARPTSSSR